MKKLVPFPAVSIAVLLSWLALTEVSPAHLALAVVFALAIPWVAAAFLQDLPRGRRPLRALQLLAHVAVDVVIANVVVARLVLGPMDRLKPAFVELPLTVTQPHAITLLATIITMTPGTVSVAIAPDARVLHVHALNVEDTVQLVALMKARYELPLKEIFEC